MTGFRGNGAATRSSLAMGLALAGPLLLLLSGCAASMADHGTRDDARPIRIKIVAFNDFHGNLAPPRQAITVETPTGSVKVPAGGAAYLASAVAKLKAQNPLSVVVSAGDMTGASPLTSSLFLDEPTIAAMNLIGVDLNAVGNHEFDRGQDELLRLQNGGCATFTARAPCQVEPDFRGANFRYLGANVVKDDGTSLFPPYAIRSFTRGATTVRIGFIGMTLTGTAQIVSAAGIAGLHFADEAKTANALIPRLRAEGADIIVLLIHQGGTVTAPHGAQSCAGLEGDIRPILDALDPAVDIVISGHTHRDYVCDYASVNPARPLLLTSAGQYGTLLTDIDILVDPATRRIVSRHAENRIVQGEAYQGAAGAVPLSDLTPTYPAEPRVQALVERYSAAAASFGGRAIGRATGPISRMTNAAGEQPLGDLIADAQLAALRGPGGAQIAFMNQGGVRAELLPGPDGSVTFGAIYAVQPFGNRLTVKSFTGRQIRAILEQQFTTGAPTPRILLPSANLRYSYDLSHPAGARIGGVTIDGKPLDAAADYRVAVSVFLGDGGDGFTLLREGRDAYIGPLDLDALEAYFKAHSPVAPPALDRIRRIDAPPAP